MLLLSVLVHDARAKMLDSEWYNFVATGSIRRRGDLYRSAGLAVLITQVLANGSNQYKSRALSCGIWLAASSSVATCSAPLLGAWPCTVAWYASSRRITAASVESDISVGHSQELSCLSLGLVQRADNTD